MHFKKADRAGNRTFMNHRADSWVWQAFFTALTEKYNRNFWLICDRCLKKLVAARIPGENQRRRKNEYRDLIAFKTAYLYKVKQGEINDPGIGSNDTKAGAVFYERK
jgi:hypothetical protein